MKLLIPVDVPNKNGRVYPRVVLQKAIMEMVALNAPVLTHEALDTLGLTTDGQFQCGFNNVENGIEVEIIPTEKAHNERLKAEDWEIVPRGIGEIVDGVMQDNYILFGFDILFKKENKV